MMNLCVSPRNVGLQYPQSIEQRPHHVSSSSPSDACDYSPFLRLRTSSERERFRRDRYLSIASAAFHNSISQPIMNYDNMRHDFINQRMIGFSFFSHSIYGDIKPHTLVSWPIDGISRDVPEYTSSKKIEGSQDLFLIDNSSTFLPKPVKRVHLKIKSVKTELPFEGDSQILCNR